MMKICEKLIGLEAILQENRKEKISEQASTTVSEEKCKNITIKRVMKKMISIVFRIELPTKTHLLGKKERSGSKVSRKPLQSESQRGN